MQLLGVAMKILAREKAHHSILLSFLQVLGVLRQNKQRDIDKVKQKETFLNYFAVINNVN